MRTETQTVEIDITACRLDAPFDQIGGLKFRQFGADEPKNGELPWRQIPQWREIT